MCYLQTLMHVSVVARRGFGDVDCLETPFVVSVQENSLWPVEANCHFGKVNDAFLQTVEHALYFVHGKGANDLFQVL